MGFKTRKKKTSEELAKEFDEMISKITDYLEHESTYFEKRYNKDQLIDHYRSHYHCAMINWHLTLDEVVQLREEVRKLRQRAVKSKIRI